MIELCNYCGDIHEVGEKPTHFGVPILVCRKVSPGNIAPIIAGDFAPSLQHLVNLQNQINERQKLLSESLLINSEQAMSEYDKRKLDILLDKK